MVSFSGRMWPQNGKLWDNAASIFHPQSHFQTCSNASTSPSFLMLPARLCSQGKSRTTWCAPAAPMGRTPARCVNAGFVWSPGTRGSRGQSREEGGERCVVRKKGRGEAQGKAGRGRLWEGRGREGTEKETWEEHRERKRQRKYGGRPRAGGDLELRCVTGCLSPHHPPVGAGPGQRVRESRMEPGKEAVDCLALRPCPLGPPGWRTPPSAG